MSWTRLRITSSRPAKSPDKLRIIAEQCADEVWARCPHNAPRMDAAELRGYARALAGALARERLTANELLTFASLGATIERTVTLVMHRQLIDLHAPRSRHAAA